MYKHMYALYIVLIQLYINFHYNECVKKNSIIVLYNLISIL